jgi:hypothetical protein
VHALEVTKYFHFVWMNVHFPWHVLGFKLGFKLALNQIPSYTCGLILSEGHFFYIPQSYL